VIVSWIPRALQQFLDTCTVFVVAAFAVSVVLVLVPPPFLAALAFVLALLLAVAPPSKVASFPPAVAAFPPVAAVAAVAFSTFSAVSVAVAFDGAVPANLVFVFVAAGRRHYYCCEQWEDYYDFLFHHPT